MRLSIERGNTRTPTCRGRWPERFRRGAQAAATALLLAGAPTAPMRAADLAVPEDFASIQAAITAAAPGDRVLVGPGVHVGTLSFGGKDVRVESREGPAQTVLDAAGGRALLIGPGGALAGFTVVNAGFATGAAVTVFGAGSRIEGNVFDGALPEGKGSAFLLGIVASPIVEANRWRGYRCHQATTAGVVTFAGGSSPTVRNNVFEDNDCPALNMTSAHNSAPLVINNTLVRNRIAIRIDRRASANAQTYRNNLVHANGVGLLLDQGVAAYDPTWEHNLVFGNLVDHTEDPDPSGALGNLALDPRLADVDGGDYHLLADSPALDAGSDDGAPAEDYEGTLRPLDGDGDGVAAVDLGAFERAPEPDAPEVVLDIRPGSESNCLPGSWKLVWVAILGTAEVDVLDVDGESLRFGPAQAPAAIRRGPNVREVNWDGFPDLLTAFRVDELGLVVGDQEACMTGELAGASFVACDRVQVLDGGLRRGRGQESCQTPQ